MRGCCVYALTMTSSAGGEVKESREVVSEYLPTPSPRLLTNRPPLQPPKVIELPRRREGYRISSRRDAVYEEGVDLHAGAEKD